MVNNTGSRRLIPPYPGSGTSSDASKIRGIMSLPESPAHDLGLRLEGPWQRAAAFAGLLGTNGQLSPTIFAEMTALATKLGAINLGQGFPDEDGPRRSPRSSQSCH